MREATGNTFIVNLLLVFLGVMIILFVGSISYSKAFKAKNRIVYIIEKHGDVLNGLNSGNYVNSAVETEVNQYLKQVGYPILRGSGSRCRMYRKAGGTDVYGSGAGTTYHYCVYKYNNEKGLYYGVVTFMHFDIPLIGQYLEFPVYGETKTIYQLGNGTIND